MGKSPVTRGLELLALLLTLVLLLNFRSAPAYPYVVKIRLVYPNGEPLANTRVWLAAYNITGNCIIMFYDGYTDSEGYIVAYYYGAYPPVYGKYNITIGYYVENTLYLGNWSLDIDPSGITGAQLTSYINTTVVLGRVHHIKFRILTDLNGDGVFETPLYYEKAENFADTAYIRIDYWDSDANKHGYTLRVFNLSDTVLTVDDKWHVKGYSNASYSIAVYWKLYFNTTDFILTRVGSHELDFTYFVGTNYATYNLTDNVAKTGVVGTATSSMTLELHGYTFTIIVDIATFCEDAPTFKSGSYGWRLYITGPSENGTAIIRSGVPDTEGVAPVSTFGAFWLPNNTAFYHQNFTLTIIYYGVVVFDEALPLNITPPQYVVREIYGVPRDVVIIEHRDTVYPYPYNVTVRTTLVKAYIQVFDSTATPSPLEGALVTICPYKGDPIPSITGPGGYVHLPPFTPKTSGVTEESEQVITYEAVNYPYGYLPVPYHLILEEKSYNAVWEIKIKYRSPSGKYFVDVTPEDNLFKINATYAVTCEVASKAIFAAIYDVKVKIVDLCGRPLTSAIYPNTTYILYIWKDNEWLEEGGAPVTTSDGTVNLLLPKGIYKLKLVYKGILMPPCEETANFTVSSNIASPVTVKFPVGDLRVVAKLWSGLQAIYGLRVQLDVLKNFTVVYNETNGNLTDGSGAVVFKEVPLRGEGRHVFVRIRMWTTDETYFIRPQDVGLLVADYIYNLTEFPVDCTVVIEVPTWIYSFRVVAANCRGEVLRAPEMSGVKPAIFFVIVDKRYSLAPLSPPSPTAKINYTYVDFRIINTTWSGVNGSGNGLDVAVWNITSRQFSKEYPHLFVAGATYRMRVIYGGVVVFDYNITLPVPSRNMTCFVNETLWGSYFNETDGFWLNYTVNYNYTFHPVFVFNGTEPFNASLPTLKLFTWTIPVEWYATDAFNRTFVQTRLAVVRSDIINSTIIYDRLQKNFTKAFDLATKEDFYSLQTKAAIIDRRGVLQYPLWVPRAKSWINGVRFGAKVDNVYVLGAEIYNTPGIPDSPVFSISFYNASGVLVHFNLTGYVLNINYSMPQCYAPEIRIGNMTFLGNNTGFTGAAWNLTYWCGCWKLGSTIAIAGICVEVLWPYPKACPPQDYRAFPNQTVVVVFESPAGELYEIASAVTDEFGRARIVWQYGELVVLPDGRTLRKAESPVIYAFGEIVAPVEGVYWLNSTVSFDDILRPYGLKTEDVVCPEHISKMIIPSFERDILKGGECYELKWSAIIVKVESWSGAPLQGMFVSATPLQVSCIPFSIGFTDGEGIAVLPVPPDSPRKYYIDVYWRDSYLLKLIKAIPEYVRIYSSLSEKQAERQTHMAGDVFSVQAYVYPAFVELVDPEGSPLPPEIVKKLTVYVVWPDKVVTKHKISLGGSFPLLLSHETVVSWPYPESAHKVPDATETNPVAPAGAYTFKIVHSELGELEQVVGTVESAPVHAAATKVKIVVHFCRLRIKIATAFGDPLPVAEVEYFAKGLSAPIKAITDENGVFETAKLLPEQGKYRLIYLRVVRWKGIPIDYEEKNLILTPTGENTVIVPTLGKIIIEVRGARGQALENVWISIPQIPALIAKTDSAGICEIIVPEGTYTIIAKRSNFQKETTVTVKGGEKVEVQIELDIYVTLYGVDLSLYEVISLVMLGCLVALALFLLFYEYHVWRTKRLARGVIQPSTPEERQRRKRKLFGFFRK